MPRTSPINEREIEFIALLKYLNPVISRQQVIKEVEKSYKRVMTYKQVVKSLERAQPVLEKLKADEGMALRVACDCGFLSLGNKVKRIQKLEEIVDTALSSGHEAAAVAGIKLIKDELTLAEKSNPDIRVVIGAVVPPKQDAEDLDISDEEYAEL